MKFRFLLLAFLLVVNVHIQAQDKFGSGFYISTNGDTVKGLIEYEKNYGSIFNFKEDSKSKSVRLSIDEVAQFSFFSGLKYRRLDFGLHELSVKPVFAKMLLQGSMKLYKYQGAFFIDAGDRNKIMLAKGKASNDSEALKNFQKNIGFFNIIFNDCKIVQTKSSQTPIKEEPLIQLLTDYYKCKSESYSITNKWSKKRIINIGLFAGYSISKIQSRNVAESELQFMERSEFQPFSHLTFGVTVVPQPRDPTSIVTLQHEFIYQKGEFNGNSYFVNDFAGYRVVETSETTVSYSELFYKIGTRFTFRSNSWAPYAALGIGWGIGGFLEEKSTKTLQTNDSPIEIKQVETPLTSAPLWISCGLRKKVGARHAMFIEADTNFGIQKVAVGRVSNNSYKIGFLF